MLIRKTFLKAYHAKCDGCKTLTRIKDKLELKSAEGLLVGEFQLCPTCLEAILQEKEIKQEKEKDILAEADGAEYIEDFAPSLSEDDYETLKKSALSVQKLF